MGDGERPSKIAKTSHDAPGDSTGPSSPSVAIFSLEKRNTPNVEFSEQAKRNGAEADDVQNHTNSKSLPLANNSEATATSAGQIDEEKAPLSKNALKRIRKQEEWESKREERKVIRKQKIVARKERKRDARQREAANHDGDAEPVTQRPSTRPKHSRLPVTFMFDCDFDNLMRDNERVSLSVQITRCYSDVKNSALRADLAICAFGGNLKDRFDNVLPHHRNWRGIRWLTEDFVEASKMSQNWLKEEGADYVLKGSFAKHATEDADELERLKSAGEIVYLSSESDETLTELKPYSTYIIGGLVDKNREKGLCHRRAVQRGVRTARLPIGEFLQLQSRKVLATNHVNEIMVKWLECGDWGEAFMKVIPKRKGGTLKEPIDESNGPDDAEDKVNGNDADNLTSATEHA